jgi:CRISPR-associated protein Csm2
MPDRQHHQRNDPPPLPDLSFLDKGYYENGALRPELLDTHAKSLGEGFARKDGYKVKSTQMRRFYGDVKELESRVEREAGADIFESADASKLAKYLALIRMLKSKAAYAAGRETVSRAFESFIVKSVDQIKTPKDFRAFVLFFEAIVGYYYGAGGDGEKNR